MKLGKTEQQVLKDITSRGLRLGHWRHSAGYDTQSSGRREVNACRKLVERGIATIIGRNQYNIYFGPRQGTVKGFEITIELKPEYVEWVKLGGFVE
jgi:hypothetical protein